MTKTPFFILFITIIIGFFTLFCVKSNRNDKYGQLTSQYRSNLRSACTSALAAVTDKVNQPNICVYDTEDQRDKGLNAFYDTLSKCFNYDGDSNRRILLQSYVPVLCLMDRNGFYISYNYPLKSGDGIVTQNEITPLNTWATQSTDDDYSVQFFLGTDGYVEVTDNKTGNTYPGRYDKVYRQCGSPATLKMLSNKENYEKARNDTVIDETTEKIKYYLNQYNFRVNSINEKNNSQELYYEFEMPKIDDQDWAGLMDQPGVVSFLQGNQFHGTYLYKPLNVYSMNGVEEAVKYPYIINKEDDNMTYHRVGCDETDKIDGKLRESKESCAKDGAFPCQKCNP